MVRVQGRIRYADKSGYFNINKNFKTKKEADDFIRFLGRNKTQAYGRITSYRKPKRRKVNSWVW